MDIILVKEQKGIERCTMNGISSLSLVFPGSSHSMDPESIKDIVEKRISFMPKKKKKKKKEGEGNNSTDQGNHTNNVVEEIDEILTFLSPEIEDGIIGTDSKKKKEKEGEGNKDDNSKDQGNDTNSVVVEENDGTLTFPSPDIEDMTDSNQDENYEDPDDDDQNQEDEASNDGMDDNEDGTDTNDQETGGKEDGRDDPDIREEESEDDEAKKEAKMFQLWLKGRCVFRCPQTRCHRTFVGSFYFEKHMVQEHQEHVSFVRQHRIVCERMTCKVCGEDVVEDKREIIKHFANHHIRHPTLQEYFRKHIQGTREKSKRCSRSRLEEVPDSKRRKENIQNQKERRIIGSTEDERAYLNLQDLEKYDDGSTHKCHVCQTDIQYSKKVVNEHTTKEHGLTLLQVNNDSAALPLNFNFIPISSTTSSLSTATSGTMPSITTARSVAISPRRAVTGSGAT